MTLKQFSEISGSNYYHNQIRFGTYKGNPIAIGDGYEGHNKVEIMNINREDGSHTWSDGARWPFRFRLVRWTVQNRTVDPLKMNHSVRWPPFEVHTVHVLGTISN